MAVLLKLLIELNGEINRPSPPAAAELSTNQTLLATVRFTVAVSVNAPSETVYVKLSAPVKPAAGS